jgi:hypothetical protein
MNRAHPYCQFFPDRTKRPSVAVGNSGFLGEMRMPSAGFWSNAQILACFDCEIEPATIAMAPGINHRFRFARGELVQPLAHMRAGFGLRSFADQLVTLNAMGSNSACARNCFASSATRTSSKRECPDRWLLCAELLRRPAVVGACAQTGGPSCSVR